MGLNKARSLYSRIVNSIIVSFSAFSLNIKKLFKALKLFSLKYLMMLGSKCHVYIAKIKGASLCLSSKIKSVCFQVARKVNRGSISKAKLKYQELWGKMVIAVLIVIMVIHTAIFSLYTTSNHKADLKVNRDIVVQEVLHVIETVITAPVNKQDKIIKAIAIPNVAVDLSKRPQSDLRFNSVSLWSILEKINHPKTPIDLSIFLGDNGWLNVSASVASKSLSLRWWLMFFELLVAVFIVFYLWSVNRYIKPYKSLANAAQRLGKNIYAEPLEENGPSVVVSASRAMNRMQSKIQEVVKNRTQMFAAISHDLRTPITRLKLRSQFIDDEDLKEKSIRDLDDMEAMIADILRYSRAQFHQDKQSKIDLASLLSCLCDDLSESHDGIHYQGPCAKVFITGNSLALKRSIGNVIENAIKYGKSAKVILTKNKDDINIIIDDQGDGFDLTEVDQLFSPFVRGEKSRSRETGGTGLGLAVAQEIIEAHNGDVKLLNYNNGGRVIITLPVLK